jgi:hypothetical protein
MNYETPPILDLFLRLIPGSFLSPAQSIYKDYARAS